MTRFAKDSNFSLFCSYLSPREETILLWRVGVMSQEEAELRLNVDGPQLHRYKRALRTKMENDDGRVLMLTREHVAILCERFSGINRKELAYVTRFSGETYAKEVNAFGKSLLGVLGATNNL